MEDKPKRQYPNYDPGFPENDYLDLKAAEDKIETKADFGVDDVIETYQKDATPINVNTAKSFQELVLKGSTPKEAVATLGITKEDMLRATGPGKKALLKVIEDYEASAEERKRFSRAALNKIALESTAGGDFDTALKAIDRIQADPEVGITNSSSQASVSIATLLSPALLNVLNDDTDKTKIIETKPLPQLEAPKERNENN